MSQEKHEHHDLRDELGPLGAAAADDTISTLTPSAEEQAAPVKKVCCVCGADVAGQTRFKDALGRYWCYECGSADSMRKHPAPCPDCGKDFVPAELVEFEGKRLCQACADKRKLTAKRAAARQAAAEEEAREMHAKHVRWLILAGCLAAVGVIYLVVRLLTMSVH